MIKKAVARTLVGLSLAGFSMIASAAPVALSVSLDAATSCSNANLDVSWTNAGNPHTEFGLVTNTAGATIGGFGPDAGATTDNYTGPYAISISTPQPPGTLIGSYAWVGVNPPTAAGSIEFMVLYNCSSKQVLYACFGPYGKCASTAAAALAGTAIPTASRESLVALALLLAVLGAWLLRRRAGANA